MGKEADGSGSLEEFYVECQLILEQNQGIKLLCCFWREADSREPTVDMEKIQGDFGHGLLRHWGL